MGVKVGAGDTPAKADQKRNERDQQAGRHKGLLTRERVPASQDVKRRQLCLRSRDENGRSDHTPQCAPPATSWELHSAECPQLDHPGENQDWQHLRRSRVERQVRGLLWHSYSVTDALDGLG
jgi:hypothetical protein